MERMLKNLRQLAIRALEPTEYKKFLEVAAKFPSFNLYNLLLLQYQYPKATIVAGENAWKDNYGVDVRDGEGAICLLRPTLLDDEQTLGYAQIGVFDISQLEKIPEVKKEEFSIPDFYYEATGCNFTYDNQDILDEDEEYKIIEDEIIVKRHEHMSVEENEKNASKQLLLAYIDNNCGLKNVTVEDKLFIKSVKYILTARYGYEPIDFNNVFIPAGFKASNKDALQFLANILTVTNEIIEQIEHRSYVEFNFAELAFINLFMDAESEEDYSELLNFEIENDDEFISDARGKFIDKLEYIDGQEFQRMAIDRQNNRMMTQPPYRCKLVEDC